ncbi:dynamin family protein [Paenibacillus shenyangensis]|uniref:dynamin family protein n=1 Tax=Paenibacillus sp. A9 TaxID=1284352 RepID=UPI00036250C1|nr:dynamin family protein [Paenibacillus sp. A9]
MQAITTQREDSFEPILEQLAQELNRQGNYAAAQKAHDLQQKYRSEELVLAFCGHFSAGKSSLMNWLCGKQVLPTSPVPTTANIAAIRCGEPRALVHVHAGDDLEIDLDELDEYCKNGGDYESVELWDRIPLLGQHGVLLDTPGVDSTDAAHEAATYSALHRADVVFYVMDYNHVQSETNLSFARTLYERGKPLYLIVNQIDKHEDQELSFAEYRKGVEQAFARRGIEPAGVLYVSRQVPEHTYGRLERLREVIGELLEDHVPLMRYSLSQAAWELAEEHSKWLNEQMSHDSDDQELDQDTQYSVEKETEEDSFSEELVQDLPSLNGKITQLQQQQDELNGNFKKLRDTWSWEIGRLVEQANLTPATLRDLAQLYLEGERPGFKKGLFASREKTMQEREQRRQTFLQAYQEQVAANLDIHVRGLLRGWSREHELWNEEQETALTASLPEITVADIEAGTGKDMAISGEYVLNYTRALREQTAAKYRRAALEAADRLLEQLQPEVERQTADIEAEKQQLQARYDDLVRQQEAEQQLQQQDLSVRSILPKRETTVPDWLPRIEAGVQAGQNTASDTQHVSYNNPLNPASAKAGDTEQSVTNQQDNNDNQLSANVPSAESTGKDADSAAIHRNGLHTAPPSSAAQQEGASARQQRLLGTAERLRSTAGKIAELPGMASQAEELRRRAGIMEDGKFTLALFGAFSAGKSSFANALLGGSVLPVSPHPMTAAITQIMGADSHYAHGTAVVFLKDVEEMQEDISGALRLLGLPDRSLEQDWRKAVAGLIPSRIHPSARAHYNFIMAAAAGWDQMADRLGQQVEVDMDDFRGYVSEEQQSCFVRRIDLYYDCDLTRQGMVLVDTPGADSVNARHTGVTFEYMKSADALVFVTYYNHAFTAGDRQLLEQLGRVKGSLALDNMFFIVNASDLASSEEEKNDVVGRIVRELNTAGIREPNIHALSSRRALHGQDEGFRGFQQSFNTFADETLAGLAVHAALEEIGRIRDMIVSWEEAARQGETYRQQRRQQLMTEQQTAREAVSGIARTEPDRRVQEESGELLFHVRQRVRLKTLEWIPEIFNPAQLNQESADLKADFAACGRELQRRVGIELEQEVLATTLRMEKAARQLISERMRTYGREAEAATTGLRLSMYEPSGWETPQLPPLGLSQAVDWKSLWSMFRNPRHFFEQGGREKLRNEVTARIDSMIGQLLEEQRERLAIYYIDGLNTRFRETVEEMHRQIAEWAEATEASLRMSDGPERWHQLAAELDELAADSATSQLHH